MVNSYANVSCPSRTMSLGSAKTGADKLKIAPSAYFSHYIWHKNKDIE
jgi:hypothetical protein